LRRFQQVKGPVLGKLEKEVPLHLTYHNLSHTIDVLQAAERIAGNEGVVESEVELLLTAALFHDTGFLIKSEGHEMESCHIAKAALPLYDYTAAEIELVCKLIMATRIPQTPMGKLAEILCDADLDYLGRDDFFALSDQLFTELKNEGVVRNEDEWNRKQADFMGSHHYFTASQVKLRQPVKKKYLELIKSKITNQLFNENQ
jgi:predicted metal-dependent HD superfamily phosphohydrolase